MRGTGPVNVLETPAPSTTARHEGASGPTDRTVVARGPVGAETARLSTRVKRRIVGDAGRGTSKLRTFDPRQHWTHRGHHLGVDDYVGTTAAPGGVLIRLRLPTALRLAGPAVTGVPLSDGEAMTC